jgi:hypothetical protein
MRILFVGDIVGKPGRKAVREILPQLKAEMGIDFVIANVENAAGGAGITEEVVKEIHGYGIDVLTGGNHTWDKKEVFSFIDNYPWLLRPANYPPDTPGRGVGVFIANTGVEVAVINLMGRLFMGYYDCPFRTGDRILETLNTKIKIIDFHAETTSEKQALGYYFAGRVSAVLGTHTHVQTSDERILKDTTAYITDVGMTGGLDGVIGVKKELAIDRFLKLLPRRFEPSKENPGLEGVFIVVDPDTGRALEIQRIRRYLQ